MLAIMKIAKRGHASHRKGFQGSGNILDAILPVIALNALMRPSNTRMVIDIRECDIATLISSLGYLFYPSINVMYRRIYSKKE
jgi:hypothetical protein